jgi:RNA polymerase sigma-70 factor (ECF subfamily)
MAATRAHSADDQYASTAEAAMAVAALTEADFARLGQIARLRARGLERIGWEDLLHEAVERALDGTRRWPSAVPFVVFMREVMRSIASAARRVQAREVSGSAADDAIASLPAPAAGPELEAIGHDLLTSLERLFADDDTALGVVRGLTDGLAPGEIQDRLRIDQTTYDSTRRRIRRKIAAAPEMFA